MVRKFLPPWLLALPLALSLIAAPALGQDVPETPEPATPLPNEGVTPVPEPSEGGLASGPPTLTDGTVLTAALLQDAIRKAAINGGSVNDSPIGNLVQSTGQFTTLKATGLIIGGTNNGSIQLGDGTSQQRFIHTTHITPIGGQMQASVLLQGIAFGTITNNSNVAALRAFNIGGDTINAAGAQGGGVLGAYFGHTISAGAVGGRTALHILLYQAGAADPSGGKFYVALGAFAASVAPAGGAPGALKGNLFGANIGATISTGAGEDWLSVVGLEINTGTRTGTKAYSKVGMQIVQWQSDAVPATLTDAGLVFAAQGATGQVAGWKHGITFGADHGTWPMHPSGTLIGSSPANKGYFNYGYPMVVANGLDWASVPVKFTTRALATPGFLVDGTGQITAGPNTIGWSSAGLNLGAAGKVGTLSSIASGGGPLAGLATGYKVGDIVFDPGTGGVWEVASVSGTAIATLTQVKAPTISSGAAPANPRTLVGGRGAAATVNLTWTDATAITMTGKLIAPTTATPASAGAACTAGETAFDSNYIYRCVAANTWKRAAIATW